MSAIQTAGALTGIRPINYDRLGDVLADIGSLRYIETFRVTLPVGPAPGPGLCLSAPTIDQGVDRIS